MPKSSALTTAAAGKPAGGSSLAMVVALTILRRWSVIEATSRRRCGSTARFTATSNSVAKLLATCAIVLISMIAPATAKQQRILIWMSSVPPVEYDKPYAGKLMLQRFSVREKLPCGNKSAVVRDITGAAPRDPKLACSLPTPDGSWCYIAIATDKLLAAENHVYASVLRHELGHCNGWGKEHERERRVPRDSVRAPALPKDTQFLLMDDLTSICVRADGSLRGCEPDDKWSVCETLTAEGKFQACKRPP